ncbi:MAG TPA: hypothetical protein VNH63_04395, partial [Gemmatimonadales bacterium]|nr:hypothetical protein [Gemmatimonadales bacterium]
MRGEAVFVKRKSAAVFVLALAVVSRSRGSEVSRQVTGTQVQPRETAQPRDPATAPITINDDQPVYAEGVPFLLTGTSLPGAIVTIVIEKSGNGQTTADASGHWTLIWTPPVKTGTWTITATSGGVTATQLLRVQIQGNVQ